MHEGTPANGIQIQSLGVGGGGGKGMLLMGGASTWPHLLHVYVNCRDVLIASL